MNSSKYIRLTIIQLLILTAIILAAVPLKNHILLRTFFARGGYYCFLLAFIIWLISITQFFRHHRFQVMPAIRTYGIGVVLCFLITSALFISAPTHVRVLSDEANMLSVSKTMTYERRTDNVTTGNRIYQTFRPMERAVEKRPLMHPFFTHLLHAVTGYRMENAFALNFLALWGVLSIIYILMHKNFGITWASSAVILVAAQPALSLAANSAGIDTFNVFFTLLAFVSLTSFLRYQSAASFQLLWFTLVLLAHCRYESIIFFFIVTAFLAAYRYLKVHFFKESLLYAFTPILFLPIFWQRIFKVDDPEQPGGSILTAFTPEYFAKNNLVFFQKLFDFEFFLPYANIVNILGIAGLVYLAHLFVQSRILTSHKPYRHLVVICTTCLVTLWFVITSYHFGRVDHPTASRFFLTFLVVLSVFAVLFVRYVHERLNFKPAHVFILCLSAFILYNPIAVQDRFTNALAVTRYNHFASDFFKKQAKIDPNFLVISGFPGHFTVYDYGSIHFRHANRQKQQIFKQFSRNLFNNIFVIQEIEYDTLNPTPKNQLDPVYELETLVEIQNTPHSFIRISKVTNKHLDDGEN